MLHDFPGCMLNNETGQSRKKWFNMNLQRGLLYACRVYVRAFGEALEKMRFRTWHEDIGNGLLSVALPSSGTVSLVNRSQIQIQRGSNVS